MSAPLERFLDAVQVQPVIAAVKDDRGLSRALTSECAAVFILYGTILNIGELVERVRAADRFALVHADLIEGLSGREISADFLAEKTAADGLISTRPNLIRRARERGLIAVQRFFVLDSLSYENVARQSSHADVVDILPAAMPQVIRRLAAALPQTLTASGLLLEKSDVIAALSAGAAAVSTTAEPLWFL